MTITKLNKLICNNADLIIYNLKNEQKENWLSIGNGGLYKTIDESINNFAFFDRLKKQLFAQLNLKNIYTANGCLNYITYFDYNTSFPTHVDNVFVEFEHKRINYVLSKPDCDIFLFSDNNKLLIESNCFYEVEADKPHGLSINTSKEPLILLVFSYIRQKDKT